MSDITQQRVFEEIQEGNVINRHSSKPWIYFYNGSIVTHVCDYCNDLVNFTFKTVLGGKCETCNQGEHRKKINNSETIDVDDMDIMEYNCIKQYIYDNLNGGKLHFFHDQRSQPSF